jgi:type I restriction-modification system DNA methylase subunit
MNEYINMDKSQYFGILKQLHDVCRNNPAPKLTGMEAYNEIINFLYLRHLSDNYDINDTLRKLYQNYCTDKHIEDDNHNKDLKKSKSGKITELNSDKLSKELLPSIANHERNKNIAFVKIMGEFIEDLKVDIGRLTNIVHKDEGVSAADGGEKAQRIINKIYSDNFLPLDKKGKFNINSFPYDALGEGFERFMSDACSTGGNWGQFFTNGQVVDWTINKVNNIRKISKKDTVSDPYAGSGGFILRAKNMFNIDGNNIYAHEYDDKIFKFLKFNSNVAGINKDNIIKGDSYDYHDYLQHYENYFDFILTNPPYGESIDISLTGDKKKADYWKQMKTGKATIKDSMGLAVYAIIQML